MFIDRKDAVAADIETTGLDTAKDEAFQIGAQRFRGDEPIMPAGEWLLRPTCPMSDEAEKVHGYSLKMLEDKPYFLAVAQKVQTYLHPKLLHVVYNGLNLDVPILQRQFKEVGYTWHPDIVDVFAFVCWHLRDLPSGERKLEAIAKRLGMEVPNSHDALADARTTASVLFRLQNDGIVPLTAAEALRQSHQFSTVHRQEFDAWKWYFYARPDFAKPLSPDTVELRIGFGKHHGKRVAQVVPSYFAFMLDAGYMGGAPEEVVQWFRQLAAGRQPDCQNHPVLQLVKELVSALVKAAAPPALPEPPAAVEPAEQRGLAAEVTKAQVERWLDIHGWNLFGSDTGAGPATFVWRHLGDTDHGVQHDLVMQPENFAYIAETHGLTPEQLLAEVKTKAGNVEMPDPAQLEAWLALKGWSWVERFQGWHVKVNGPELPVFKRHSNVAQISWKPRDGINKELLEALVELYELGSVDGLLKNVAATDPMPGHNLPRGVHGPGLVAAHAVPDSWSGAELPTAGQFTACRMSWEASRHGSADTLLSEMPGTLRWLIEEGGPMVGAIAWELERNRDGLGLIVLTIPEEPVLDTLQLQELADNLWRAANAALPALETGEWAAIVKEQGDRPLEQVMTIQVEVRQHGKGSEGNWTGFVKGGHPAPGPGELLQPRELAAGEQLNAAGSIDPVDPTFEPLSIEFASLQVVDMGQIPQLPATCKLLYELPVTGPDHEPIVSIVSVNRDSAGRGFIKIRGLSFPAENPRTLKYYGKTQDELNEWRTQSFANDVQARVLAALQGDSGLRLEWTSLRVIYQNASHEDPSFITEKEAHLNPPPGYVKFPEDGLIPSAVAAARNLKHDLDLMASTDAAKIDVAVRGALETASALDVLRHNTHLLDRLNPLRPIIETEAKRVGGRPIVTISPGKQVRELLASGGASNSETSSVADVQNDADVKDLLAAHPELAALVFGWRGNPKLARFGTTQRHASVIDRLCSCGVHAAGKAIDATIRHLDGCKAVVCTDEYPHIAEPCPVCESTPEEFQEYLSSSRNAVHNEILARAKLKKVRAELADKISAITDKGEAEPADLSSQYRGTAILMSELLLPEIQQRAVKYIAPGSAVTVQPTEAQPESPAPAMPIFPSGSYEEINQTLLQAGKYMVGGEVVTVPPGRTLPIPSLPAAGIPVIVSPYVDHPTPMDLGDGPVVVTPSKEAAIEAVKAYNARQQPEQVAPAVPADDSQRDAEDAAALTAAADLTPTGTGD